MPCSIGILKILEKISYKKMSMFFYFLTILSVHISNFKTLKLLCVFVCCGCVHVHHMYAWCQRTPKEGAGSHGTGVTDGCET